MNHIKLIIGLGNPGQSFYYHRHSIGFRILDVLAKKHDVAWQEKSTMMIAIIQGAVGPVYLVKPSTFMNNSGAVMPFFTKKGIKPEEVLVVHDELEMPFGKVALKQGGSARGHNGLKSIIAAIGDNFNRLRVGIGRPDDKAEVPGYVLSNFTQGVKDLDALIDQSVIALEKQI